MSAAATAIVLAGAVLLVLAGVPKAARPHDTVRGLRSAGLPAAPGAVRALAVVEVLVGLGALAGPGRVAALAVAALYAGFTAFVLLALGRGGVVESCGCLGEADTPPTRAHALATGLVAAAGLTLALAPTGAWWADGPGAAALLLALAALLTFLLWQVIAVLPTATAAAARSVASTPTPSRG